MEHKSDKPQEIKLMERALHDLFWQPNRSPALRQAKSDFSKGRLSPNRSEALLIQFGWEKQESSRWVKTSDGKEKPSYSNKRK